MEPLWKFKKYIYMVILPMNKAYQSALKRCVNQGCSYSKCQLPAKFVGWERGDHWMVFAGRSLGKRQWTAFRLCTDNYWIYEPYQTIFMYMKSLEKTLNIGATIMSRVTGIKSWFEHTFKCSVFSFRVLHPPSCKHLNSPAFKVLWR